MTPSHSKINLHHIYIPSKPHPNGTLLRSAADENKIVLSYKIRRRTREDFDQLVHRTKLDLKLQRNSLTNLRKKRKFELISELYDYPPDSVIVADRLYGGLPLLEEIVKQRTNVICACKANRPSFIFSKLLHHILIKKKGGKKKIQVWRYDFLFWIFTLSSRRRNFILSIFCFCIGEYLKDWEIFF